MVIRLMRLGVTENNNGNHCGVLTQLYSRDMWLEAPRASGEIIAESSRGEEGPAAVLHLSHLSHQRLPTAIITIISAVITTNGRWLQITARQTAKQRQQLSHNLKLRSSVTQSGWYGDGTWSRARLDTPTRGVGRLASLTTSPFIAQTTTCVLREFA